jgi:hypothetical protein
MYINNTFKFTNIDFAEKTLGADHTPDNNMTMAKYT